MRYILARFYELGGRVGGPMTFRLVLQPTIATLVALRAGLRDAREGRPAYFWALLTGRGQRIRLLREGWRAIFKIFILVVIMDVVHELTVLDLSCRKPDGGYASRRGVVPSDPRPGEPPRNALAPESLARKVTEN
jgi:hypothetical protein